MNDPDFILLYVDNAEASGRFYAALLGKTPVESSPAFVMFILDTGVKLGLWSRDTVQPEVSGSGATAELAFAVTDAASVRATHADWTRRNLAIVQQPTDMDFGHTFVALDPDGHRLRVYAPVAT